MQCMHLVLKTTCTNFIVKIFASLFCNNVFYVATMMTYVWLIIVHKFDTINFSIMD